jgi:DNA-3-methyladenine glycosylase II
MHKLMKDKNCELDKAEIKRHLTDADPILKPYLSLNLASDTKNKSDFTVLSRLIVNQQLSGKVADSIFGRIKELPILNGNYSPITMLEVKPDELHRCGISKSKAQFILSLSELLVKEPQFFENLKPLNDAELLASLVELKGVGSWTASLFMMSYYQRTDIFPYGDASLRKAVSMIYGEQYVRSEGELSKITLNWSPYRTFVARLLWKALDTKMLI